MSFLHLLSTQQAVCSSYSRNIFKGGAVLSIMISSPNSKSCTRCEPSMKIRPRCEFHRTCSFSFDFTIRLLMSLSSKSSAGLRGFCRSIMCSRIKYWISSLEVSMALPPAANTGGETGIKRRHEISYRGLAEIKNDDIHATYSLR
jgi:hypothetical protein